MDLLRSYKGDNSDSSTTPPTTPRDGAYNPLPRELRFERRETHAPNASQKQALVTGTMEPADMSDMAFKDAQRRIDATLSSDSPRNTVLKRPRPASPPRPTADEHTHPPLKTTTRRSRTSKSDPTSVAPAPIVPSSTFHLSAAHDYQNRAWHQPDPEARTFEQMETYTPYIPKSRVWQAHAHTKPASSVSFSRPYGNIFLTTGLDGVAKMWHTSARRLARRYTGHAAGIRAAAFAPDAESFLTAAYDRRVLLWSTETGRVRASFRTRGTPVCVAFTPGNDHEFVVGCSDKKVVQLDTRDANKIVQSYDQHMGVVNSITFIDHGRRFVSSSDDKVLRVWEYGVPVVIKYVTDPSMHSMPVTLLHPNRRSLACQSMDNSVRIYTAKDKFKRNDKKAFKGQLVAGYACGLTFSPDGRFLGSGDSLGRLFFWDWRSTRLFRTLQAHNGVCIDLDWHPNQSSLVASCGWDGTVMLWD